MGRPMVARRDGDKAQARALVRRAIETGRLAHPNELPCALCGHLWIEGERRHEYDHDRGYDAENHLNVRALCTLCHAEQRPAVNQCVHGHEYSAENTGIWPSGGKYCRTCRRERDRKRKTPEFWREWRAKRKAARTAPAVSEVSQTEASRVELLPAPGEQRVAAAAAGN